MDNEQNRNRGTRSLFINRVGEKNLTKAVAVEHQGIKWGPIFAGALVSVLVYAGLMSLGLAIGGGSLVGAIQGDTSFSGLGWGAAIWTVVAVLVSLYSGGHIAARVSGLVSTRVGRAQGLVVAGLFFAVMFSQLGSAIGSLGSGIGWAVSALGGTAANVAQNPTARSIVEEAVGDLNLKSSPDTVVQGVALRLIRGEDQAALNYLAAQSGISQQEAQARIDSVKTEFRSAITSAGIEAGQALKVAGWTLFGALLLGSLCAMIGGGVGAQMNLRVPISKADRDAIEKSHAA